MERFVMFNPTEVGIGGEGHSASSSFLPFFAASREAIPAQRRLWLTRRREDAKTRRGEEGRHTGLRVHAPWGQTRAKAAKTRGFCRLSSRTSRLRVRHSLPRAGFGSREGAKTRRGMDERG
jgi:hypothetical protein